MMSWARMTHVPTPIRLGAASPSGGCRARRSRSACPRTGGRTFPRRIVVEDGPGTCTSNDSTDGRNKEMSYPWLLEGPDGMLHIAYTHHRRAIKYVRLAPGWQHTTGGSA